jgi:hypothetical protein
LQVVFEARSYVDGMEVMGFGSTNQTNQILSLHVIRCRFCSTTDAKMVSALASMALQWRTSWLSIWSGNHLLVDAEDVSGTQVGSYPTIVDASVILKCHSCSCGQMDLHSIATVLKSLHYRSCLGQLCVSCQKMLAKLVDFVETRFTIPLHDFKFPQR